MTTNADEIETTDNVFEALDLPYHAKAAEVLTRFHGLALTPAVTKELLSAIVTALREAEAGEREACAKIVDTHKTKHRNYAYDIDSRPSSDYAEATRLARECEAIAAAIREKGE